METRTDNAVVAPQLCFGTVRHRRLRPTTNAFDYGVYFLRLPLRTLGAGAFGPRLFSRNRFNLLSFHDRDHGDGKQALLPWIDGLLRAEGITDADGEIWLQAFPRVLGYVFNPVAFWFCHRIDGTLRAVVCEVRNTFGEKHCYLLDTGAAIGNGVELRARKQFHVSPFCKIEGGYRFRFMRSLRGASERTLACIDHDDASGPLLLTSISGSAAKLSNTAVATAFFTYPLMTIGVVVRIHWQALKLFVKRVPFISKPLPPSEPLSR
ncbi:DUF1365 family protein [Actimicrobium sp. GrIS 1.19]|uniref:DUF1365 domain-containing protein n=1 Tax=Actimicrobium sp. GrIS 1.19 TaxID=3071708 RepID=UPI002E0A5950|nr:DUF1365 family protein [Actimicrobium sp. GrIS 1.19]